MAYVRKSRRTNRKMGAEAPSKAGSNPRRLPEREWKRVRFIDVQGPPVPIPNTEVKLHSADNT